MEYKNRKTTRLASFDYNTIGAYFITFNTQNKEHLLSQVIRKDIFVRTDVLDGPYSPSEFTVELTEYGMIAEKYIKQLNDFYTYVSVAAYVIMPNHIHLLINVHENGPSRTSVLTDNGENGPSRTLVLTDDGENGPSRTSVLTDNGENGPSRTSVLTDDGENGPSRTSVLTDDGENPRTSIQHSIISKFISTFKRFSNKEYGRNVWQMRSYDHVIRDAKDYETHIKYIHENPIKWYFHGENHDDVMLYE